MPYTRALLATAADTAWDAIVVGAGPAGALAAYELARRDLKVLLVERKEFPRYKVCGACVSAAAVEQLARSGLGHVVAPPAGSPLRHLLLGTRWGQCRLPIAAAVAVPREQLDLALLQAAQHAGALLLAPVSAQLLPPAGGGWRSVQLHGQVASSAAKARIVIMAAGLGGAGRVGGDEFNEQVAPGARLGIGAHVSGAGAAVADRHIAMAVCRQGYVGMAPLPDGSLSVAAALDRGWLRDQCGPKDAVQSILNECGFAVSLDRRTTWHGTPLLTRTSVRKAAWRVLLVGDAAGYVEPFTGEGMAWAFESARAVASLAEHGVRAWSAELELQWQTWHATALLHRQQRCRRLTAWLRYPWAVRGGLLSARLFPSLAARISRQMTRPATEYAT